MDDFEIELKRDFLQEASELLTNAEQSFLQLENDRTNGELIDTIFRVAHNLKGTSRAVGFGQIAELTHVAENLLLAIKQGKLSANTSVVSTLLSFNDKVREMVEGLSADLDAEFSYGDLLKELESHLNAGGGETHAAAPVHAPDESAFNEESSEIENECKNEGEVRPEVQEQSCETMSQGRTPSGPKKRVVKDDETLRVSVQRLEKLNDIVGELVILETQIENTLGKVGEVKTARSLGKLCKGIQDLAMSLRMVPIGPTFSKLNRVVRDTSGILGKKVNLQLIGEDTEIDKMVVESLGDPLVHIIRNAIDHGIESPQDRLASGKSEEGTVEVMAFHEGNFLIIQITDDGKGINPEVLLRKAREKGIIKENDQLTEMQAIELIFHPGLSSKEEVSEVSGRGVGMDVVRTNIESLGGEVRVQSRVGQGSCFRLMLPLTLAIIEGMLIESRGQIYVIPKSQVQEVIRLEASEITKMTGRVPYLKLRDEVVPVFDLGQDMGGQSNAQSEISLIVKHGELQFGVSINDVIRLQQVVVKPATREISGQQGIMGTTILGDGKPSLILDLLGLYASRVRKERTTLNNQQAS